MIYVYINKSLLTFEADIRDMCMAFFSYKKIIYLYENEDGLYRDKDGNAECSQILTRRGGHCPPDVHIKANLCREECSQRPINVGAKQCEPVIRIKDYYNDIDFSNKNRKEIKLNLKRKLYDKLKSITKKDLSWGTLTGIRPVTIVTDIIENEYLSNGILSINDLSNDNHIYDDIKNRLKLDYYLSNEKATELIDIANKEIETLNRNELKDYKQKYSIYIGVPFCRSTCLYCSFTSFNIDKYADYVDKYLSKLEYELKTNEHNSPMTLYIGGGTPTSLNEKDFEKMLSILDKYISKDNLIEWTVEAGRPDTITKEKFLCMKKYGVTRISINPQSFNQKTLDIIGRKHTVEDVVEKYYMAREIGFDNINMDIILGLPNERLREVKNTLEYIKKLKPDSLTVHSLALKRSARLNKELNDWTNNYYFAGLDEKNGNIFDKLFSKTKDNRIIDKMFLLSMKYAKDIGLEPYYLYRQKNISGNLENVGYSSLGKECIYNIMMMSERHSVYGFGTGTTKIVTYNGREKIINNIEGYKSVIDYCAK